MAQHMDIRLLLVGRAKWGRRMGSETLPEVSSRVDSWVG